VYWLTDRATTPSHTGDEFLRELTEIDTNARKQGQPLIATIYADREADDSPLLSIGLGADESVLVYSSGRWNDESGFSKGARIDDTTEVSFHYGTGVSEYLGSMLLPKETAFAAAQEFFRTGHQPTCVEWETCNTRASRDDPQSPR
jgi:hypothetical protein